MNDDLTRTLSEELEERSHAMDGSTLHLVDVRGRARSIRRRRTASAVAGVAAAVAVIVPVATLATHTGGSPEPAPPVTQSVTPTPSADQGTQPPPGVLDVSDLPTGAPPAIPYLGDGSSEHPFEPFPATSFAQLSDGSDIVVANDEGDFEVYVTSPDGSHHGPFASHAELAVNPAHSVAAWVDPTGQVQTWGLGDTSPFALGDPIAAGDDLRVAAVTGDDCSLVCAVDVNVMDGPNGPQPWEASLNGTEQLRDGSYLKISDQSPGGLTIGYRKITEFGSCSALLGGGEFQGFTTCKHTLVSFSPDERLILADPAYHDGIGNGVIAMYDLDGNVLFDRHSTAKAQSHYPTAEWEDATHVLAPVFQDGKWSIVRIASDGSMEYAVPPTPGDDVDNPYVLATGGASAS